MRPVAGCAGVSGGGGGRFVFFLLILLALKFGPVQMGKAQVVNTVVMMLMMIMRGGVIVQNVD